LSEHAEVAADGHRDVVIVGAGFSGLYALHKLRGLGFTAQVLEAGGGVGGTWYWNRYPGIHCDIEATVYLPLLDELGVVPTRRYAPGEEIRRHADAIAAHYDLLRSTYFHTRATSLTWDDESDEWIVTTDREDELRAGHVVVSSGTLSQAKLPRSRASRTSAGTPSTPAAGTTPTPAATRPAG
jgi:cation diffusion facilitator CzcD-associated flavoprotein CzcO